MKRTALVLGSAAFVLGLVAANFVSADEPKTVSKTFEGAPIDLVCYMDGHSGIGDPSDCAEACIAKKGLPAGILTKDGDKNVVYVVVGGGDSKKIFEKLGPFMNKMAKITGDVTEIDNLKLIEVKKVEALPEKTAK